jgi:hypothetical protein
MAKSRRKDQQQQPAADQGDAYEPATGEAVDTDFPPAEPAAAGPGRAMKEWVKSLTVTTDPDVGMRFHFDYASHLGVITFEAPPSAAVTKMLHDGGYRFQREVKAWLLPLASGHWEADRKHAKKVFWQASDAARAEKGLPPRAPSQDQGPIPD